MDAFCLDPKYSTTRLVTRQDSQPAAKVQSIMFLPPNPDRKGEGGLRTKGYFKQSLPDKPLISVITVVFKGEKHLEETIQSVINQTYDNVEYIIIDGGSTDGTLEIISKYDEQIDYWVSEPDDGIYDAMNKGWLLATFDAFILFINSGDLVITLPNHRKLIPENIYVGSVILSNGTIFNNKINFKLHFGNTIHHQGLLINKLIYPKQPFNIKYATYADFDFNQRLYKNKINFEPINDLITYFASAGASQDLLIFEMANIVYNNYGFIYYLLALSYLTYQLLKSIIAK